MSDYESPVLPGTPPPALRAVLAALSPEERSATAAHLLGGSGAEWLAECLKRNGHPVSATTIHKYRRSIRNV